ncbi:hypothetical protein LCGC14_1994900 [marine sediment metagenome]|uniref:Uncharacterized protein n=1 Tax=marine sediment metagenome TaxID=412755 RepID=A0A0F9I225_9ZZZZ
MSHVTDRLDARATIARIAGLPAQCRGRYELRLVWGTQRPIISRPYTEGYWTNPAACMRPLGHPDYHVEVQARISVGQDYFMGWRLESALLTPAGARCLDKTGRVDIISAYLDR